MVFSSIVFLFGFLPLFFLAYYASRGSNITLLAGSILFYAWGEFRFLWLLGLAALVTWIGGLAIFRAQSRGGSGQFALGVAIIIELSLLGWFKYADFAAAQLAGLGLMVPLRPDQQWALPLGISFFSFHAISYLMDIYRRAVPRPAGVVELAVYIVMFPQLVAGPIVRYAGIAPQLTARQPTIEGIAGGIQMFVLGLAQKVLIANTLAAPVDRVFAQDPTTLDAGSAWTGAAGYMLQLYFDFGGYSLMAIGLGRMMGLTFPQNFDSPYVSRSVTEFWRRWHMSLSSWFRDYVYIPLGGNRGGRARTYLHLWTVFLLCGLWHGAAWTFVLWGAYHGAFLAAERAGIGALLDRLWLPLRHLYTLLAVLFGWVLFRADTPVHAWHIVRAMFAAGTPPPVPPAPLLTPSVLTAFAAAIVASLPWSRIVRRWLERIGARFALAGAALGETLSLGVTTALAGLLVLSAASLATGTYSPFIYFRF